MGLPCLAHDCALTRYVLGNCGLFADFEQPGGLALLIRQASEHNNEFPSAEQRYAMAFDRFGWQCLQTDYIEMLQKCAKA